MSTLPRFAHLLSNAPPPLPSQSRAQLYRSYLQHIRLLPDPHLWSVLIPQFRKGCLQLPPQLDIASPSDARKQRPAKGSEWTAEKKVEALRVSRMERRVKKLRKELTQLRAAVACHPHALTRLLEEAYAQRGPLRYQLIQNIASTTLNPKDQPRPNDHLLGPTRSDLPIPLHPLRPPPIPPDTAPPRARTYVPPNAGKRKALKAWHREWEDVPVPLVLPHSPAPGYHASPRTGWEGRGVVESLRSLAGLDGSATPIRPETLPTFAHLPLTVQSSFPSKLKPTLRESPIPRPAPRMTRSNPRTWHHPIRLDKRLLRRSYARLWESLVWVHPGGEGEGDGWVKCGYGEMKDWEAGIQAGVNKAGSPGEGVVAIEEDREGEVKKRGKERKEKRGKKAEGGEKVEGNGLERWSVGSEEDRKWLAETPNA